jgi:hypothetical protein
MDKQKYEREIEEILEKYEKESGRKTRTEGQIGTIRPAPTAPVRRPPQAPSNINWRRLSSGQYMAAAFAVALLAVLVGSISQVLATILVIVSVVLFLLPVVLYRSTGNTSGGWSAREQKRWRGQVIDINTRRDISNDPIEGIKRWFRKR